MTTMKKKWMMIDEEEDDDEEALKIMVDLDEASLCDAESNLDWNSEVASQHPNDSDFGRAFALRDVKEGDEILCNYSGFCDEDDWAYAFELAQKGAARPNQRRGTTLMNAIANPLEK